MSALLDSLARAFDGDATRRVTLDATLREGLPKPRSEAWKYTSLRALERRAFAPAETAAVDARGSCSSMACSMRRRRGSTVCRRAFR